jgi:hypothetical protein
VSEASGCIHLRAWQAHPDEQRFLRRPVISEQGIDAYYLADTKVYKCEHEEACMGSLGRNSSDNGGCATGYTGPMCGICDNEYYMQGGMCQPCEIGGDQTLSFAIICLLFIIPLIFMLCARTRRGKEVTRILFETIFRPVFAKVSIDRTRYRCSKIDIVVVVKSTLSYCRESSLDSTSESFLVAASRHWFISYTQPLIAADFSCISPPPRSPCTSPPPPSPCTSPPPSHFPSIYLTLSPCTSPSISSPSRFSLASTPSSRPCLSPSPSNGLTASRLSWRSAGC